MRGIFAGNDGELLIADSLTREGIAWQTFTASSPLTTKGDLMTHDSAIVVRFGAGANGLILMADSGQAEGLSWVNEGVLTLQDPTDASWADGLFTSWTSDTTTIMDALDNINEALNDLAPATPLTLAGASLTMAGVSTFNGNASAGAGQFFKSAAGEDIDATYTGGKIVLSDNFTLTNPTSGATESGGDDTFSDGESGTLSARITKSGSEAEDGSINLATATPPETDAALTLNAQNANYNSFALWVRGDATIDVDATAPLGQGYNKIVMRHAFGGNRDSADYEVFNDTSATVVTVTTATQLAENTKVSIWLSGVEFYADNSTFDVSFQTANNFKNTYQSDAFGYSGISAIPSGTVSLTHAAWNGTVSNPPDISDVPVLGGASDFTVTASTNNTTNVNARLTMTFRKPGRSNVTSQSQGLGGSGNLLIHTYSGTGNSTALLDSFNDENRRLPDNDGSAYPNNYDSIPGAITGQWTTTADLVNGEAQVYNGSLWFPTINFSSGFHPSTGQPDYSAFSGDQVYLRAIFDSGGTPHSSGTLEFTGLTGADVGAKGAGNINVEIKLPTQTGWLDLGTDFDSGTFTGADGDGCRTAQSGNDWSWTASTFSTADSGDMIIVRISFRNSTDSISELEELDW
jgi:hypothetical protein